MFKVCFASMEAMEHDLAFRETVPGVDHVWMLWAPLEILDQFRHPFEHVPAVKVALGDAQAGQDSQGLSPFHVGLSVLRGVECLHDFNGLINELVRRGGPIQFKVITMQEEEVSDIHVDLTPQGGDQYRLG